MKHRVIVAGVGFTGLTSESVVEQVSERISQRRYKRPISVFTPNTEQLIQAVEEPGFLQVLNSSEVRVPDSIGVIGADWWRAFTTGRAWKIRERVAGVDLAENLLSEARVRGWKVTLIGGRGKASESAVGNLKKRFGGLDIWKVPVGKVNYDAKNMDLTMENEDWVINRINEIRPDLLLVGFGAPKQEVWVMKYGGKLSIQAVMVVGGAIDMWSGIQTRAPQWMRQWGLEWLWRLGQQPWRIGRQLRLVKFGWMVLWGRV
ncbi:MAG TPA: WecB/TagA/CpsF family glycosyltransferase [Anaerolineales bacterium]|nr:WecB/TagA/CpsF family glycosyltransferase [Anaerolineales bacterium]